MSKINHLEAQPSSILRCLEKLVRNDPLADQELIYMIETVFLPSIRKRKDWILSVHGTMQTSRPNVADEQTEETPASEENDTWPQKNTYHSAETTDFVFLEDQDHENETETAADIDVLYCGHSSLLDNEGSAADLAGLNPAYLDAISELWVRFSKGLASTTDELLENQTEIESPLPDSGSTDKCQMRTIWAQALDSVQDRPPNVMEKEAIRYLRACASRVIINWCSNNSLDTLLRKRLSDALRGDERFDRLNSGDPKKPLFFLANKEPIDAPNITSTLREKICSQLSFEPLKSGSKYHSQLLPSVQILRVLMLDLFSKTGFALHLSDMISIIKYGWGLNEMRKESLPDEYDEEMRGPKRGLEYGPSGEKNFIETDVYYENRAIQIAREIKDAVQEVNKQPIMLPVNGKKGKLGRLFTEFFLWYDLPAAETLSGAYGIEKYAEHTGYAKSTEYDRWTKKLLPLIRDILTKHDVDNQIVLDVIFLLRTEFFNSKPEFVHFDLFSDSTETNTGNT